MNKLFPVTIMHHRLAPKIHRFFYKTFYLCLDVSHLEQLNSPLLGFERYRPYTLRNKDYGFKGEDCVKSWLQFVINTHNLSHHKVYLITMPRVLGYGFNPISFWLFFDENYSLKSVIADVNNTFGENHQYLIRDSAQKPLESKKYYEAEKVFHVSPFFSVEGTYRFRFLIPENWEADQKNLGFWIDYMIDGHEVLLTSMTGSLKPLTQYRLLKFLIIYPFMTILVVGRIHYQAFKLWIKGLKYYPKPSPPKEKITE
jgi:uncharacterized protein